MSGGGGHGDTTGRQVYVGNVSLILPSLVTSSCRTPLVGKISRIFSVEQVHSLSLMNLSL